MRAMPIVPVVFVNKRVTVAKQGRARRGYSCASCGYRAEIEVSGAVRAQANGSSVAPRGQIEREARELADAALADEMRDLYDLIPCPKCKGRSENAGLYRQNTVLAILGCLLVGAAMGGYTYMMKPANATELDSPVAGLVLSMLLGIGAAAACWYRRSARISRVASAVQFFPEDEEEKVEEVVPRRRRARHV
ncbi:MAG: hypothetical protein ABJE95_38900 [Byssovorax sp.]